jgi:hypothetical protein
MKRSVLVVGVAMLAVGGAALAHEERLVSGRVGRVDLPAGLLVVEDPGQDTRVRVTVDADTAVRRCRAGAGLAALAPGARVRVKYLDRGDGGFDTLSVLVLPERQGR